MVARRWTMTKVKNERDTVSLASAFTGEDEPIPRARLEHPNEVGPITPWYCLVLARDDRKGHNASP